MNFSPTSRLLSDIFNWHEKNLKPFSRASEKLNRQMKTYTLILLGLLLAGCTDQGIQFTPSDDAPFREDLENRLSSEGGDGSGDDMIDWIINTKGADGSQGDCEQCSKVDLHFYIGFIGWTTPTVWHTVANTFSNCRNKFAKHTYRKGFLSHLQNLNWQFSHSMFSSGKNQPGYLEFNGDYVEPSHRAYKKKSQPQSIMNRSFPFYEDIFSYTLTRFSPAGDSFYSSHPSSAREHIISYDAPKFNYSINKNGLADPLAGLSDLLDNRYGAIREGSRVEIFIVTDTFPDYSEKELNSFIDKYKGVRIHLLSSHPQSRYLGGLVDLAEQTGGAAQHLCKNKNIGPELAEIVKHK